MRWGPEIARESFGSPSARAFWAGESSSHWPGAGSRQSRATMGALACLARHLRVHARPNEALQLPGDGWKEVVVAAALARSVDELHLPDLYVARS